MTRQTSHDRPGHDGTISPGARGWPAEGQAPGRGFGRARRRPLPSNPMSASSAQYIYTMHKVSRFHPPDKEVLKDITLSFYPGAKIGVIGSNGPGKSSLLRIMVGFDESGTD